MNTSSEPNRDASGFVVRESSPLLAWLFKLDTIVTNGMGGLLSEREGDLTGMKDVLDLGCGAGGWLMELAHLYPEVRFTGLDNNVSLMEYVRTHARSRLLENVEFLTEDIRKLLPFEDASFDLINARTLFSSFFPHEWPPLLKECLRILRPGGTIRLTELERSQTNSPAIERFWDLYAQALYKTGRSFSLDGRWIGIVPHLGRLLHEAGFHYIRNRAHTPDISAWTPNFAQWQEHSTIIWQLLTPFIVKSGVATEEEFQELCQKCIIDIYSEHYNGLAFFLTTWGQKLE